MPSIQRDLAPVVIRAAERMPVVTLVGPRQSGKSTLCRMLFPHHRYRNLEEPDTREFATQDPRGFLAETGDGAVLDEIQRAPELLSYIQTRADEDPTPGRWILTGSQNLSVLESVNQSLAGRTAVLRLLPLSWVEVRRFEDYPRDLDSAMLSGGYPRIFDRKLEPSEWLSAYVATYIERDVRTLTNIGDLSAFQRFVQLCAGRTSQLLNLSALASDAGISQPTAKAWLSVLEAGFICYRLTPWFTNVGKRLIKTPKLHFLDTGVVCWLLGIRNREQLVSHPLRGAIFESWVAGEIIKHRANRGELANVNFYRDVMQFEADVVVERGGSLVLVDAKAGATLTSDAFDRLSRTAQRVGDAASVERVLIYGGDSAQSRSGAKAIPWAMVHEEPW